MHEAAVFTNSDMHKRHMVRVSTVFCRVEPFICAVDPSHVRPCQGRNVARAVGGRGTGSNGMTRRQPLRLWVSGMAGLFITQWEMDIEGVVPCPSQRQWMPNTTRQYMDLGRRLALGGRRTKAVGHAVRRSRRRNRYMAAHEWRFRGRESSGEAGVAAAAASSNTNSRTRVHVGCTSNSRKIITCGTCLRPALTIAMATGRQPGVCLVRAEVCFGLESQLV